MNVMSWIKQHTRTHKPPPQKKYNNKQKKEQKS